MRAGRSLGTALAGPLTLLLCLGLALASLSGDRPGSSAANTAIAVDGCLGGFAPAASRQQSVVRLHTQRAPGVATRLLAPPVSVPGSTSVDQDWLDLAPDATAGGVVARSCATSMARRSASQTRELSRGRSPPAA